MCTQEEESDVAREGIGPAPPALRALGICPKSGARLAGEMCCAPERARTHPPVWTASAKVEVLSKWSLKDDLRGEDGVHHGDVLAGGVRRGRHHQNSGFYPGNFPGDAVYISGVAQREIDRESMCVCVWSLRVDTTKCEGEGGGKATRVRQGSIAFNSQKKRSHATK